MHCTAACHCSQVPVSARGSPSPEPTAAMRTSQRCPRCFFCIRISRRLARNHGSSSRRGNRVPQSWGATRAGRAARPNRCSCSCHSVWAPRGRRHPDRLPRSWVCGPPAPTTAEWRQAETWRAAREHWHPCSTCSPRRSILRCGWAADRGIAVPLALLTARKAMADSRHVDVLGHWCQLRSSASASAAAAAAARRHARARNPLRLAAIAIGSQWACASRDTSPRACRSSLTCW